MPKTKASYYWLLFFTILSALIGTSSISARAQGPFGVGIPRTGQETIGFNESNNTKMSTTELGLQVPFPSISQRIINELGNATSDEIATYPINDLSPEVLVKVLNGLSVDNLFKVLVNLPHGDLKTLLVSKLIPQQSKEILNRIPQDKKAEIQNRMN